MRSAELLSVHRADGRDVGRGSAATGCWSWEKFLQTDSDLRISRSMCNPGQTDGAVTLR